MSDRDTTREMIEDALDDLVSAYQGCRCGNAHGYDGKDHPAWAACSERCRNAYVRVLAIYDDSVGL